MRKLGLALVAVGAFLIVLAPMVRFYAYPNLAVAPVNQNSITTLVGPDATIFDISSLKEIQTDLTTKVRTVGDAKAAEKAPDGTVVWVSSSSTTSSDGVMRSRSVERVAFDAHTAQAVNCCGEFISETEGEETPVKHEGLLVKFPFHTEKKTYDFWDGSLLKAVPIQYRGTEDLDGLTVYKFEQTIEPTKVGEQKLPLSLLGLPGDETVTADSMYSNVRTLWVEPVTGVIIKRAEQQDNTFNYDGEPRITTTKVTTGYDDKTVQQNIDDYSSLSTQLHLLRSVVPLVSLILGIVLLVAGLVLASRSSRGARARV
jgi:hypothetical protein